MREKIKNAGKGNLVEKARRKIRGIWVRKLRNTKLYPFCYRAYWHSIWLKNNDENIENLYLAARPNPGAGIGHQMANWIAGYWFAEQFGLKFAHIPFSNQKWEEFLGFYQNEITVRELKSKGFKIRRIPMFDESNDIEVAMVNKIIGSYRGKRIIFLSEQDQFYRNQFGVLDTIQSKFFNAPARKSDKLIYHPEHYNISIHVRRGDIMQSDLQNNANLAMRFQSNDYFVNALKTVLNYLKDKDNVHIYLFSQGKKEDYQEFKQFKNLHFCLDMGAQESFLHMVYADALITSKSSFSYKPALLNKGIKFCPKNFWHGYPESDDWVMLNDEGNIV